MGVAAWALVISSLAAAVALLSLGLQIFIWRKASHDVRLSGNIDYVNDGLILTLNVDNQGRGGVGLVDAWIQYGDDDGLDIGKTVGLEQALAGHDGRQWKVPVSDDVLGTGDVRACVRLGTGKVVTAVIPNWA